ncbi:MAG: alpha/beta hydrolase [Limnochordia bacterium]|nr:alpha/beta hydrolase [Limnochordia bacterium]MDD2630054.1 alpha/beta hydrolase [Limnochordia bacterium]MDD4517775.1 alpha/beta hydrolase [Limnochordia bacterium]
MASSSMRIWPDSLDTSATITPYLPKENKSPTSAVLVCPGGGYSMKAQHEGEPVALWLNSLGIAAFVLDYRVAPHRYPAGLLDARRAMRYLRHTADTWHISKDRIGVLGFSAGGHLASCVGTVTSHLESPVVDAIEEEDYLPNAMILCYPVISFVEHGHLGSAINLLGDNPPEAERLSLSTHRLVTEKTPPTFLWHTADDAVVPVENSLMFAAALSKHRVPFALHVFPQGPHGMSLATNDSQVSLWTGACATWLRELGF